MALTDNEIIKALEWCTNVMDCGKCLYSPYSGSGCATRLKTEVLDLIKRQQAEIERLEYTLIGVMHSVDKWLEGEELEQDEVNRAIAMREKTLQIVEEKQEEIERLKKDLYTPLKHYYIRGVKEFTKRLCADRVSNDPVVIAAKCLEKEMTEGV